MAASRKSQLFLHSVLPVTINHDELIKRKLKPGKFVLTPTGIIKLIGQIVLLAGITFFWASGMCDGDGVWREVVFSVINVIVLIEAFALYLIFSTGYTVKNPWLWVKLDIATNLCLPLLAIVLSAVAISPCSTSLQLHEIPLPMVIAANVVLIISTGTLFLLYRYMEDEDQPRIDLTQRHQADRGRKSIFA